MPKLIVTTSDSGAGALKAARIADRVVGLYYSLVDGPAPAVDDPISFFARKQELSTYAEDWESEFETEGAETWKAIGACALEYDVELWADPTANGQLQSIQLLSWWKSGPGRSAPLSLFQAPKPLGYCLPDEVVHWREQARPIAPKQFAAAELAWQAYCSPTPETWHALARTGRASELPIIQAFGTQLLAELPSVGSALSHTQMQLLALIEGGTTRPQDLFGAMLDAVVYGYWTLGRLLDELASCEVPAVSGLRERPFSLELHDDADRFANYNRSKLELTDFGRALLAGEADWAVCNRVNRWWGGTHVTNDNLWRWDANELKIVSPRQD